MDKFTLTAAEQGVFDLVAQQLRTLNEGSQYRVLGVLAHAMDREVNKPGALRTAAAAAKASARISAERKLETPSSKKKGSKGTKFSYPSKFLESGGQALLDSQKRLQAAVAQSATEENRRNLRLASESLRDSFRAFTEGTEN